MAKPGYRMVSIKESAREELAAFQKELHAVGRNALPAHLRDVAGDLTLSEIIVLGVRTARERISRDLRRGRPQ
jgi:hypothetical protein